MALPLQTSTVEILFNYRLGIFEPRFGQCENRLSPSSRITLLNLTRDLSSLPIQTYKVSFWLAAAMLGLMLLFCVLLSFYLWLLLEIVVGVSGTSFLASLVALIAHFCEFKGRYAKIKRQTESAKPKIELLTSVGLSHYLMFSFGRNPRPFCTLLVENNDQRLPDTDTAPNPAPNPLSTSLLSPEPVPPGSKEHLFVTIDSSAMISFIGSEKLREIRDEIRSKFLLKFQLQARNDAQGEGPALQADTGANDQSTSFNIVSHKKYCQEQSSLSHQSDQEAPYD